MSFLSRSSSRLLSRAIRGSWRSVHGVRAVQSSKLACLSRPVRLMQAFPSSRPYSTEAEDLDDDEDYEDEVRMGDYAPKFSATGVFQGKISTYDSDSFRGRWLLLFFYPNDFTFVCPTELLELSDKTPQFEELGCQVLGASVDSEFTHLQWMKTPRDEGGLGGPLNYPLLADPGLKLICAYGAQDLDEVCSVRATFLIDPEGKLRHMSFYEDPCGRNIDEFLRIVKACQFADEHGTVCPVNWQPGQKTITPDPEKKLEYFQDKE